MLERTCQWAWERRVLPHPTVATSRWAAVALSWPSVACTLSPFPFAFCSAGLQQATVRETAASVDNADLMVHPASEARIAKSEVVCVAA